MERFIFWLAKVFNVNLVRVEKEVITEVKYLTEGTIQGDVCVIGNLTIDGELSVSGGVTFYNN